MNDTIDDRLDSIENDARSLLRTVARLRNDLEASQRIEQPSDTPEFLTSTETCKKYRLSRTWCYRHLDEMIKDGVAFRQPGNTKSAMVRVDAARFDAWWRRETGNRQL